MKAKMRCCFFAVFSLLILDTGNTVGDQHGSVPPAISKQAGYVFNPEIGRMRRKLSLLLQASSDVYRFLENGDAPPALPPETRQDWKVENAAAERMLIDIKKQLDSASDDANLLNVKTLEAALVASAKHFCALKKKMDANAIDLNSIIWPLELECRV